MTDETISGFIMQSPRPSSFSFQNAGGFVLKFNADGTMEIGPGLTPDEAGRAAIDAMRDQLKFIVDAAVAAERERCAKIAEEMPTWDRWVGTIPQAAKDIASAIRNRASAT